MSIANDIPITFRYFQDPHHFSSYSYEPDVCNTCGQTCMVYEYGSGPEYICEQCLSEGRFTGEEEDYTTNEGDVSELRKQLGSLHPELLDEQIETLVQQRTTEIERRTPPVLTWQHFFWPVHCGDYCCYLKEAGKEDLNNLSPDGDGQSFLEGHLYDEVLRMLRGTTIETVWQAVRPDSPEYHDEYVLASVGVYLYQCLHCGEFVILHDWD